MDQSYLANGHGSQTNGLPRQHQTSSQEHKLRVPTVKEALPYSPFSSVVPFNADLITPPLALPSAAPTAFHNYEDVKTTRRELERLSAGARSAENASKRCQQTLRDVQRMLDGNNLTQYKFKTTKRSDPDTIGVANKQSVLSSFARMVYQTADVQYRYLTPESDSPILEDKAVANSRQYQPAPSSQGNNHQKSSATDPPSQPAAQPRLSGVQIQIPEPTPVKRILQPQNGHPRPSSQHVTPTPSQTGPAQSTPSTAYIKPTTPTPAQLAEFKKIPESASSARDSTPSRNQSAYLTNAARAASVDEKHKGNLAVRDLNDQLQALFQAEDQMQPDTSGDIAVHANALFRSHDVEGVSLLVLQTDAQLRLDNALQKVVAHGRLDNMEFEHLVRVQRLCECSLTAAESESLHIGEDWSEQDVLDWLGRLNSAQNGLVAARAMMRVMTGGSNHKELQSEDYLRAVLDAIRTVVERCIIPIVEERSFLGEKIRGEKGIPRNPKFDTAVENRKALQSLVQSARKCLRLLGDLLTATDLEESGISNIEYLCKTLIFTENASMDKESALGTVTFENLRVAAMDVLGKIFTKYTDQRNFIFDEILLSLEKLPAKKQSARQFSLKEGKPIQLVSALLMRLVQTSATFRTSALRFKVGDADEDTEKEKLEDSEDEEDAESDDSDTIQVSSSKRKKTQRHAGKARSVSSGWDLSSVYKPLLDDAQTHASYIVRLLLQRALTASKTSDEPFRRLLDLFTEDFLSVLGNSDWPAAELLLRTLVARMIGIAENHKSPAPSRTLSLELLGTIGSGILDIQSNTVFATKSLPSGGDDLITERLADMGKHIESGDLETSALTAFEGPYRIVIEYLDALGTNNDPQLQTARGYHLVQWAELVCCGRREDSTDGADSTSTTFKELQSKIRHMIEDMHWLEENTQMSRPSTAQGKAAARIVASNSPLCKAFTRIFNVILHSLSSEQPTVRSRGIKSVTTLLEKDPSVLDRNKQILNQIFRSLSDHSALVRDSALGLVQKCVSLRPALELAVYERIIARTHDMNAPVRKRAMAFLKQVYLRNNDNRVRAFISDALIARIKDIDESVADTARATIEEVWFTALRGAKSGSERDVDALLHLRSHAALVIQTVDLVDNVAAVLEALIKTLLTQSKQATANILTCRSLIQVLFDGIINTKDIPGEPSQGAILRTLTVFAKAAPKLFTPGQLEHLEPYAQNLQGSDDLDVYHHAVTILRYTMPVLSNIRPDFLKKLQKALVSTVGKLPKSELTVVAPCLWTIDTIFGGTESLVRLVISALNNVYNLRGQTLDEASVKRASRLIILVGQFGKACNFDDHLNAFKTRFPWYKGKTAAGLLVEISCHFTSPRNSLALRQAALAAVCEVCSSFPEHFLRADVVNAIETVLKDKQSELEEVLLTNLEEFFNLEETSSEEHEILGTGIESGTHRLGNTYQATGYDTASASISQRFLPDFLRIALSSMNDVALAAARVVVHINTRGMAHPAESSPSLAALETCPNTTIAKLAFLAHKEQFTKHENVFEKGLVKAVQQAFDYQRTVVDSTSGLTGSPPVSKLHFFWEVLKGGKAKVRHKFFTNLCASVDFDHSKLKVAGNPPQHLLYTRFCVENVAMLEFSNVEEPLHLLSCLEKVFAGTGTSVAQAIESEVLQLQIPVTSSQQLSADPEAIAVATTISAPAPAAIDANRLRQLAVSAQVLSLLWETRSFVSRLYNLQKYAGKPKKLKKDEKDLERKVSKATNATALTEGYQAKIQQILNMDTTEEAQRKMCTAFIELSSVDTDIKVGSDHEEEMDLEDAEDDRSEGSSTKSPAATPRGKKRKSIDDANGPLKKRSRLKKSSNTRLGDEDDDDDWL